MKILFNKVDIFICISNVCIFSLYYFLASKYQGERFANQRAEFAVCLVFTFGSETILCMRIRFNNMQHIMVFSINTKKYIEDIYLASFVFALYCLLT